MKRPDTKTFAWSTPWAGGLVALGVAACLLSVSLVHGAGAPDSPAPAGNPASDGEAAVPPADPGSRMHPGTTSTASGPGASTAARAAQAASPGSIGLCDAWETFTRQDGLPSDKTYCVRVDGDRVWVGTDAGLACYEEGRWRTYAVDDGLAHPVVLAVDVDIATGDVWIATMAGLSWFSAGRFETFNQFNSGLANDVVYSVACEGDHLWAATASGASRLNTLTGQWVIFNEKTAPMHEPWVYGVSANDGLVYIAVWGGGVVEFNTGTQRWRDYRDPDKEMEIDLFPHEGLVHDVTSAVSFENGILWVATYFGMNRYDGARWRGYFDHDSGLLSNFINFIKARGPVVWVCTDKGLNAFDGETWVGYRRVSGGGELLITDGERETLRRTTSTSIAHNYVMGVDFQGDTVWVATARGVSRGKTRVAPRLSSKSPRAR